MSEYCYTVERYGKAGIKRREVAKETKCFITYRHEDYGRQSTSRVSKNAGRGLDGTFPTWQAAHDQLMVVRRRQLESAKAAVDTARNKLAEAQQLTEPAP